MCPITISLQRLYLGVESWHEWNNRSEWIKEGWDWEPMSYSADCHQCTHKFFAFKIKGRKPAHPSSLGKRPINWCLCVLLCMKEFCAPSQFVECLMPTWNILLAVSWRLCLITCHMTTMTTSVQSSFWSVFSLCWYYCKDEAMVKHNRDWCRQLSSQL